MVFENLNRILRRAGGGSSEVPYHPPPSIGHEIGVIFGGIGSMIVGALLFYLWWRVKLAREIQQERERVEDLRSRGLLDQKHLEDHSGREKEGVEVLN